jgi:hypothetical protein
MPRSRCPCFALLAALLALAGCSISYSVESLSKSVSSPFASSSRSSGEESDPAYQEEVRSFAAGFARSGGGPLALNLVAGVGEIAVGLLRAPADGGRLLLRGVHGALVSLPELAFVNLRKGTNDWVPESAGAELGLAAQTSGRRGDR